MVSVSLSEISTQGFSLDKIRLIMSDKVALEKSMPGFLSGKVRLNISGEMAGPSAIQFFYKSLFASESSTCFLTSDQIRLIVSGEMAGPSII